jgi:hypothetical protein
MRSKTKVTTLRSFMNELSYSQSQKSVSFRKKEASEIMKERFSSHIKLLKGGIGNVEEHCDRFGGREFIQAEMDRN